MPDEMTTWPEFAELEKVPKGEYVPFLISYLKTEHERRNTIAMFMLTRLGVRIQNYLAHEAVGPRKSPEHRIRILEVIEKVGEPLTLDGLLTLIGSCMESPAVRAKIRSVMLALRVKPATTTAEPEKSAAAPGAAS